MAATNYTDVLDQLRAAGLMVEHLELDRIVRCRVEGDRERRGWYTLHELQGQRGDLLLVGSYGIWHGNDNGARKIELKREALTTEQRDAMRKRLAEDRRHAARLRAGEAERAARRAAKVWAKCDPTGESPYLLRKGVGAHGVRFSPSGAMFIPMLDTAGRIHGLQAIRPKKHHGRDKEYWPKGLVKKGHFHLIGAPSWVVLIAEGYATAATLHEATSLPVAVAFDAGNIQPVAEAMHKRYPAAKILICSDRDDLASCKLCKHRFDLVAHSTLCPECLQPHERSNAGAIASSAAALAVGGAHIAPEFADPEARVAAWIEKGAKPTDFNDLHLAEGLHVVRTQVEARLTELAWRMKWLGRAAGSVQGGRGGVLRPIESLEELLERFALVYGKQGTVFDRQEHMLVSLTDMQHACVRRALHKAWMENSERDIVRPREVGFDPAGDDPNITCNLWAGWPTEPKAGNCERLLELLEFMCGEENNRTELYNWVLNWLAYPIQHPGAKMKTCIVVHGMQGTGKNLFFEAIMSIYGEYGRIVDQNAIEDKYNDWASRKLFMIADEVVARAELFHIKNLLKGLITGEWIRINPKHVTSYDERNHVNMVFLSNEPMPVVLEEDDRRHCVIWTPPKESGDYYAKVKREIDNGGIAALHNYLLHRDLGDFKPSTAPPSTSAKRELVRLALDSPVRFYDDVIDGELNPISIDTGLTGLATDWYEAYRTWCNRNGHRPAPQPKFVNALVKKRAVASQRKRYLAGADVRGPHGVLMFDRETCPEGKSETTWLGERIDGLRRRIDAYKGAL